jgi:hypothetical protein
LRIERTNERIYTRVKLFLTVGQKIGLLRMAGRRSVFTVSIDCFDRLPSTDTHMNMETSLLVRVGQAILAVSATGATVLVLQLAMVAA